MSGFSGWMNSMSWGRRKYEKILNDPEKKSRCIRYGVISVLLAVVAPFIVFGCVKGAIALFSEQSLLLIFSIILGITLAVSAFLFAVYFLPLSLINAVRQLKMDKKAGGYIGIVFFVLSIIATVYAVIAAF